MSDQPIKKMRRSKNERMIAGVCGGIAQYFFIDPVIVRGVFVLLGILNGIGVILYVALAIIMPEDGEDTGTVSGSEAVGPAPVPVQPVVSVSESMETPEFKRRRQLLLLLVILGVVAIASPLLVFFSFLGLVLRH